MRYILQTRHILLIAIIASVLFVAVPFVGYAQGGSTDLRDTVRAAILSDPRTAELSESEIEAMVGVLTEEAVVQGVTSEDIVWRPDTLEEEFPARCGGMPVFFCTMNEAFGFDGSDPAIPVGLGISSALLLFVIGSLLLHRHGHHVVAGEIGMPQSSRATSAPPATPTE